MRTCDQRTRRLREEKTRTLRRTPPHRPAPYRVLVVDDDPSVRSALLHSLVRHGYAVNTASSGSTALEIFDGLGADLVILDVKIPDMSGLEVCRLMKCVNDVPILMITADRINERLPQLAREAHADSFLRKPLNVQAILDTVARYSAASSEP